MKQVIKFQSPKEHYKADACILWCIDARLTRLHDPENSLLIKFIKEFKLENPDVLIIAGGAKDLNSPGTGRKFLFDQLDKIIKFHQPKQFSLVVHMDCGAYKGEIIGDETEYALTELKRARRILEQYLTVKKYTAEVKTYLADFNGLWEVE